MLRKTDIYNDDKADRNDDYYNGDGNVLPVVLPIENNKTCFLHRVNLVL